MIVMSDQLTKPLYSIKEVTEMLSVSDDTVRKLIQSGELKARKIRGQWRIYRESLERILQPPADE